MKFTTLLYFHCTITTLYFLPGEILANSVNDPLVGLACEAGFPVVINCNEGERIEIRDALYGRDNGKTCGGQIKTTNCNSTKSFTEVQNRCEGKSSCVVSASNRVFGDPCFGTTKYLRVWYVCKDCEPMSNKLIVEGSILVNNAEECQTKCQLDPDCKFFTYNSAQKACGLRNYVPGGRAVSFGNLSGLKDESPSIWKQIPDSVYVGNLIEATSSNECQEKCQEDQKCKVLIFNGLFGQCSLFYGVGPYRELPLPSTFDCLGISSAYRCSD